MSVGLQRVKKRIGTARQIRQVTSAMRQVARARLVHDRRAMESSNRYTRRLVQLLQDLSHVAGEWDHPLLRPQPPGPVALIVFGSDRGLCGGYNAALMQRVATFIEAFPGRPVRLLVVGKVPYRRALRLDLDVAHHWEQPRRQDRADLIDTLTSLSVEGFLGQAHSEVHVLYSRFASGLLQVPTVEVVLPVPLAADGRDTFNAAIFEPDAESILYRLLPEYVRQLIDHAFLNGLASENAARQIAMSRATDNANEMLDDLMASYRRLRQATITTEMLELLGGAPEGGR
jgi:F-type H+-transporting ATPase subunit gamma